LTPLYDNLFTIHLSWTAGSSSDWYVLVMNIKNDSEIELALYFAKLIAPDGKASIYEIEYLNKHLF